MGGAGRALRQPRPDGDRSWRASPPVPASPGDRPPAMTSSPPCTPPAGRGGTLLYVPTGVRDRSAAARPFGAHARQRRFRPLPDRAGRGRRGHAAGRDRQQRSGGAAGLHCGAVEILVGAGARLRYVNLQNWGERRLAFRPSKGARRPRRLPAMDHRRPGQPPGQSESARGPRRRRGPCAGQRRDVHRRHASTSPTTRSSTTRRRIAPATCSTRGPCRASRASSGGA